VVNAGRPSAGTAVVPTELPSFGALLTSEVRMSGGRYTRRTLIATVCVIALPVFALLVIGVAIGIAVTASRQATPASWNRWANVGQAFESVNALFSGLAFVALVVTFSIQYQELRMQRLELQMQREAMNKSNGELRRSAEADLRRLHVELIKMSINDPTLAAVWPDLKPDVDHERNRQFLYANLIIQHIRLNVQIGGASESEIRNTIRWLFNSPVIRDYWAAAADVRAQMIVEPTERQFADLADEIYSERGAE